MQHVKSKLVHPKHVDAVSQVLGIDKDKLHTMTADDIVMALCVAIAKMHGHLMEE